MSRCRHAFTLIELLVVIAIIAILAAILFPVFSQAKAAAKKTADLSNQKQLVVAVMLYAGDNDDRTAVTHHDLEPGETIADLYAWHQPLMPYLKSRDVLRDPGLAGDPSIFPEAISLPDWQQRRTDYLINGFFAHGCSMTLFSQPAGQILIAARKASMAFFDYHPWPSAPNGDWERGMIDGSGYAMSDPEEGTQHLDPSNTGRHLGGSNYSFADGHAKWMKFAATLDRNKPVDAVDNWGLHNIDSLPAPEEEGHEH